MCVTAKELIRQAYEAANGLPPATAELVKALASKLDVSMAATSQACEERTTATSELAQAKQHIAELEESHAQVIQSRDHYKRMSETSTVTMKPTRKQVELMAFITGYLTDPKHDSQSRNSITAEVFRIALASLKSRTVTVKLPEPFKMAKSSSGLTYYYADDVNEALAAAGISLEVE